jgi:hypothetical protein
MSPGSPEILTRIYTLHEPGGELRYVGKTIHSLSKRHRLHITNARRGGLGYLGAWIRKLLRFGLEPEIRLLQVVVGDSWPQAEKYWIDYFRTLGCPLVNLTEGGDGHPGHHPSEETKAKIAAGNTGRIFSVTHKERISEAARHRTCRSGWHHSEEARAKLREAAQTRESFSIRQASIARRTVNPILATPKRDFERPASWRVAIGEANQGSRNGAAKLNENDVVTIKKLLLEGTLTQNEIANKFDVSRRLVGMIQTNQRWTHVPWPLLDLEGTHYALLEEQLLGMDDDENWLS